MQLNGAGQSSSRSWGSASESGDRAQQDFLEDALGVVQESE
jgi:hypothetical protein